MPSPLHQDFESGNCSHCDTHRADMKISATATLAIGYHEWAVSARIASMDRASGAASSKPLQTPISPPWASWCTSVTGKPCINCFPVIRAKWLLEHPRFPHHGALPKEAFVRNIDCQNVYFISHRWETPHQPDVKGWQALFFSLFLATRFDEAELEQIGVWYDYSVLPQEPRSQEEQLAFDALIRRIPDIQMECQTIVSGDLPGIQEYASRAWCLLEYFSGNPVHADFVSGGIPYKQAANHAVAQDATSAVLYALAYLMLPHMATEEKTWTCPKCQQTELLNSRLQAAHQCLPEQAFAPEIANIHTRLKQVQGVVQEAGIGDQLPEFVTVLLQQRRRSYYDMLLDFNWALHCGYCHQQSAAKPDRPSSEQVIEALRQQLSLCRDKYARFLLKMDTKLPLSKASVQAIAKELDIRCTEPADMQLIMGLMQHRSEQVMQQLSRPSLIDENGSTAAHLAAKWQELPMLEYLLAQNPELLDCQDHLQHTLLHSAVLGYSEGKMDTVLWLLKQRPDFMLIPDRNGYIPVALAIQYSNEDLVKLLLNNFPKLLNWVDSRKNTLLHLLAWNVNTSTTTALAEYLLSKSPILVEALNAQGESALHLAAQCANVPLTTLLLKQKPALAQLRTMYGDTALHLVIEPSVGGSNVILQVLEIMDLLLEHSPETVIAENEEGLTPLDLAEESDEATPEMLALMRRYREKF